jgi:lipoprotein-releasing system ATP-binding protein
MILQTENLSKSYGKLEVLRNVSLTIQHGEIVSITGRSGAGKSTLLHLIGTLDKPDNGIIRYGGEDVAGLNDRKLSAFRNKNIGFVFQFHHLLPEFTALENVCIPAYIQGITAEEAKERATRWLEHFGLASRLHHKPSELSGGEQQRVAVARALINQPMVLLADEPSGNLDSRNAEDLHKLFFKLRDEFGQTIIVVTHNESLAAQTDRQITMEDGMIVGERK